MWSVTFGRGRFGAGRFDLAYHCRVHGEYTVRRSVVIGKQMYYVLLYYKVYLLNILRSICNKNSTGIESKQASRSIYNSKIKVRLIKSTLSLYSLYYAEACKKFVGLISASLPSGNTAPFEELPQRSRAVGNTMFD